MTQLAVQIIEDGTAGIIQILHEGPPGRRGEPGEPGDQGPPGIGSEWHHGSGAPGIEIGGEGDYYLDSSSGDIYGPRIGDNWGDIIFSILEGQKGENGGDGQDGREIELQKDSTHIQWRYEGESTWQNLIALSEIKGDKGDQGDIGPTGIVTANEPLNYNAITKTISINVGTTANSVAAGNDSRLDNSRNPLAHKTSHATGGTDALTPGDIGAAAATHGHTISNVTGLQSALDEKAASVHGHAIADVSGLSSALQAKADLVNGVLPTSQLPALAITQYLGAVANQTALLALTGERGDWAIRLDRNSVWILSVDAPSLLGSWVELPIPSGVVLQVNNQTGVVTLGPGDVGAEPAGTTAAAFAAHIAAANPHNQYELKTALKDAAYKDTGTTAGTLAAGDDARFAASEARLNAFRDAATFYVSKRITASDSNNGTSEGEPFLTVGAAVAAANTYVTANPGAYAKISVGPGRFVETSLPLRLKPQILVQGSMQRGTIMEPAAGQELNGFFALDSGCMVADIRFAGHQATGTSETDSSVGTRAWAIRFNEQANGGQGVFLTASPYVKDCASITAEDDSGLAGSTSTGDTGGGIEVDGAKCHPSSPVRSMVVYGFTQQNLGGPGVIIKNDAYAELVSFFGLFCSWHVQAETGGWATLSGGGCSEFGTYGVVADGYSATALYSGSLRVAASAGALSIDVVGLSSNRLGSSNRPHNGQIMLIGGTGYVVTSSSPINASGTVVADSDNSAGYRVSLYNPTGTGLVAPASQGATADFRRRSQVSAGCHTALFVGSGTNYNALPWNGGVPIRANVFVERNFGRVFGLSVNDAGDLSAAGGAFAVDGTSGAVTINTSSFNISGLNTIGPFSRNGGISTVGVQIQEISNNTSLISSTGLTDGNTVPTQVAVVGYVSAQLAPYLTSATAATSYQPLSANLTGLAANNANHYLARANHTGTQPASTITGLGTLATQSGTFSGTSSGTNTGDQTITLTGEVTGSGTDSVPATLSNSAVIGKVLTGYTSGAGTITATDTILQAIQKLNGNDAAFLTATSAALTYQPLDEDLSAIAALTTTPAGRSLLTLLAVPAGALVGTTDTQTLTNKTLGNVRETEFAITDTATVDLVPSNGAIQTWVLGGARTATANNFPSGSSMLLAVDDGTAGSLAWPSITWVNRTTAPTLATTGYTQVQLWKIGTTLYGTY